MDPCECHATMHLWIRQLECECKFAYNYNSRHAYKDKKPPNWPGKRKGALGAWAYKKAKNRFQIRAAKFLGLPIGNYIQFLTIRFYVKSILLIEEAEKMSIWQNHSYKRISHEIKVACVVKTVLSRNFSIISTLGFT